jgi:hypothetical protein
MFLKSVSVAISVLGYPILIYLGRDVGFALWAVVTSFLLMLMVVVGTKIGWRLYYWEHTGRIMYLIALLVWCGGSIFSGWSWSVLAWVSVLFWLFLYPFRELLQDERVMSQNNVLEKNTDWS